MRPTFGAALLAALTGLTTPPASAQSPVLRFQIIEADGFTESDPAIADVRQALSDLFKFRGYRLAAETVIRVNGGEFAQAVATPAGATYQITGAHVEIIRGEHPEAGNIMLRELRLWVNSPVLETSLTVPIGQTVVVGSARPSSDGPTLILVVRTQMM